MNKLWLPEGAHHDLNFEHNRWTDAGAFTGGGWKLCWHITVSPWVAVDSMVRVLKDKNAAPHLVIGGRPGFKFPVVVQMLPFNRAGRALANTSAGGETNRANVIQVEICARPGNVRIARGAEDDGTELFDMLELELSAQEMRLAARAANGGSAAAAKEFDLCITEDSEHRRSFESGVGAWTDDTYKALANMHRWVENRVPIPRKIFARFDRPRRLSSSEWVKREGHGGHVHCPENIHWDPTPQFKGKKLLNFVKSGPHEL